MQAKKWTDRGLVAIAVLLVVCSVSELLGNRVGCWITHGLTAAALAILIVMRHRQRHELEKIKREADDVVARSRAALGELEAMKDQAERALQHLHDEFNVAKQLGDL